MTPELKLEMTEVSDGKKTLNQVRKATWAKDGSAVDIAIVKASGEGFEGATFDTEDIKGHHGLVFPLIGPFAESGGIHPSALLG